MRKHFWLSLLLCFAMGLSNFGRAQIRAPRTTPAPPPTPVARTDYHARAVELYKNNPAAEALEHMHDVFEHNLDDATNYTTLIELSLEKRLSEINIAASSLNSELECVAFEQSIEVVRLFLSLPAVSNLGVETLNHKKYLDHLLGLEAESFIKRVRFLKQNRTKTTQIKQLELVRLEVKLEGKAQGLSTVRGDVSHELAWSVALARIEYAQAHVSAYQGNRPKARGHLDRAAQIAFRIKALAQRIKTFEEEFNSPEFVSIENESGTTNFLKTFLNNLTSNGENGGVAGAFGKLVAWVTRFYNRNSDLVFNIIIGVLIFWGIPLLLLKLHLLFGDIRAMAYERKIWRLGFLGYLAYLASMFRRRGRMANGSPPRNAWPNASAPGPSALVMRTDAAPSESPSAAGQKTGWLQKCLGIFGARHTGARKKSLMQCSSCRQPIDIIEHYMKTLNFDACPHCGIGIEQIFRFEEYIENLIKKMVLLAEQPIKTRRRKNVEEANREMMGRLLEATYALAVRRRATDIHIQRNETGAKMSLRVDGMLTEGAELPPILATAYLSAFKVQASLDITNHTTPQDGRINLEIDRVVFDLRVNCAPTPQGEILFLRLLDKRRIEISPAKLGFEGQNLVNFDRAIHRPHGLILVTGPTGSGKSTTLYVAMNQINTGERNIITIEDPVEYQLRGLKQMQVNPDKKFTFATGLRSVLRQDPDVIMVGEIRDRETANMAVESAGTGHLVLTTLHTMDTAQAISRLSDLGVPSKRYASALELILAQRLVRIICENCKVIDHPSDADLDQIGLYKYRHRISFHKGDGCKRCNYTGYYGRIAVLEMLRPEKNMRVLLESETRTNVLRAAARKHGLRLLREDAAKKISEGLTTVEEVIRVAC